jgi:WD40 repeat protein
MTVLFYADGDLWRTDLQGSQVERLTTGTLYQPSEEAWRTVWYQPPHVSPRGRWLAVPTPRAIHLFDLRHQTSISITLPTGNRTPPEIAWAPDEQRLAYVLDDRLTLYTLSQRTSQPLFTEGRLWGALWSPDGCCIATVALEETICCQGMVWVVNTTDGKGQQAGEASPPPEGSIEHVVWWSPSGDRLLIGGPGASSSLIYNLADDTASEMQVSAIGWSPDGRYLLTKDLILVDALTGQPGVSLGPAEPGCRQKRGNKSWAWSPDGQSLAGIARCQPVTGDAGVLSWVYVSDMKQGKVLWRLPFMDLDLEVVQWSADGTFLVLDVLDPVGESSPIWRLRSDGTGEIEEVIAKGFLVAVVPQWEQ